MAKRSRSTADETEAEVENTEIIPGEGEEGGTPEVEATADAGPYGQLPDADAEYVVAEDYLTAAPEWVDRGWSAYDTERKCAALAVPVLLAQKNPPYTTQLARKGDTIKYTAPKDGKPPKYEIIPAVGEAP